MVTIGLMFLASLLVSLFLTPLVRRVAFRYQVLDTPTQRKVHSHPVPRLGGVAVCAGFGMVLVPSALFNLIPLQLNTFASSKIGILLGLGIAFGVGLWDDIHRLRPEIKLAIQTLAALAAYWGGARIEVVELPWDVVWSLGRLSLPGTVLWFLMIINGINLIDGLDGLAAGVTLFACLTLVTVSMINGRPEVAGALAVLAGGCLGFLWFNSKPQYIFLGDGGSYFLGYVLASLSILGSMKSHATVAILIPILALGLPLVDICLAPIRRFMRGRKPFQPDNDHIHHKLLRMGLSNRQVVFLMYGIAILFGLFALAVVKIHNEMSALILFVIALSTGFFVRRLGYFRYLDSEGLSRYLTTLADESGLGKQRRRFLEKQIMIGDAQSFEELWDGIVEASQLLAIDSVEIQFNGIRLPPYTNSSFQWCEPDRTAEDSENPITTLHDAHTKGDKTLSINLPLADTHRHYGMLILKKDLEKDQISHYTLSRIEHLRRSIVKKVRMLEEQQLPAGPLHKP